MLQGHQPPHTQELTQAVRAVDKHLPPSSVPPAHRDEIFYVECHADPETNKDVVLWEDILQAFESAVQPRRIAAMPDTLLDVIVNSPVVDRTLDSPQVEQQESTPVLPPPSYESTITTGTISSRNIVSTFNASSTTNTYSSANPTVLLHNPVYDVEEAMMDLEDNSDIDIPLAYPLDQGLQALVSGRTHIVENLPVTSHQDNLNGPTPQSAITDVQMERDLNQTSMSTRHGHSEAQVALGDMYRHGHRTPQDYRVAMEWYLKAAERGYAPAQYNIGDFYCLGYGVPKDFGQAMRWYLKAANQAHVPSLFSIGFLYYSGQSVPQDYARAMHWYVRAANRGYALAQHNVGLLYSEGGRGVRQDYTKAMDWYFKAALQGYAPAQYSIGLLYDNGRGVPQDYSKAMAWYLKAAKHSHAASQFRIGCLYEYGFGVLQNKAKAREWYRKAAEQGHSEALFNLAGRV